MVIHVLFSPSAAGTLRQLLRSRGVEERVADLTEWLDTGWIASDRIEDRIDWFEKRMPWKDNWAWSIEYIDKFLAAVGSDDERLIWLAPRSAQEQSGLYWYFHRTRPAPTRMIVADYALEGAWRGEPPRSLGELDPEAMAQLLDRCTRVEWDSSRFPIDKWARLMDDAAVLRVVEDGVLTSAGPDHYDEPLLRSCPEEWTKWARVVANVMAHADQAVDDLFLRWRLQELIDGGLVECTGDLPPWDIPAHYEHALVRRRQ